MKETDKLKAFDYLKKHFSTSQSPDFWAKHLPEITLAMKEYAQAYANSLRQQEVRWVRGRDRLPSLFKTVKWRNADGGNIPLPDATPLEHYERAGANIEWHEWLDESGQSIQPRDTNENL